MESNFRTLADKATVPWVKKVYSVIARSLPRSYTADSIVAESEVAHSSDDIEEIKSIMYDHVKGERSKLGQLQTLDEAVGSIRKQALSIIHSKIPIKSAFDDNGKPTRVFDADAVGGGFVRDGFWNPQSGIGSVDDPGMYNYAYVPVSMSPQEATAYYASGGIPAVITDKKAKGCLLNGYTFEGDGWTPDEFKRLGAYGERVAFGAAIADSLRDGLIFGGAIAYPRFKQDNVKSLEMSVNDLVKERIITKNCIDHFVTADRWNCVLVPNWNVTARDYLTPSHYYIPIGGVKVSTERSAIVRPKMLPYWGMLPQIGWGISDFEGYITSVLAYQITVMSIPIMAQQMSLLFHFIPLDGALAQNGASGIGDLLASNDAVMRGWSSLHPASVNSFGEIKAIERHYEGFAELVNILMTDICARGEMPQTVIFPSQPKGLADSNTEDVLLKQAESVQKITVAVGPQFRRLVKVLAMSCFGPEYFAGDEGMNKLASLALSFNPPSVQTAKEKADSGGKFADFVQKLVASELPVDAVLDLSKQFFPDIEIPESIMARIRGIPESSTPEDYEKVLGIGGIVEKLIAAAPTPNLEKVLSAGDIVGELAGSFIGKN